MAFVRLDVASSSNFELAFLTCIDLFGQVDILVNNAGINAETSWETQLDINLKAVYASLMSSPYLTEFFHMSGHYSRIQIGLEVHGQEWQGP